MDDLKYKTKNSTKIAEKQKKYKINKEYT